MPRPRILKKVIPEGQNIPISASRAVYIQNKRNIAREKRELANWERYRDEQSELHDRERKAHERAQAEQKNRKLRKFERKLPDFYDPVYVPSHQYKFPVKPVLYKAPPYELVRVTKNKLTNLWNFYN